MKNLLFDFQALGAAKDAALKKAVALFTRSGAVVVQSDVDQRLQRVAGITFRRVHFTFADGQTVSLGVKQTGDVFQARVNGKDVPIKDQDDHAAAIAELVARMDRGRSKFQAALARTKVVMPTGLKSTLTMKEKALRDKVAALTEAVAAAREQLASMQAAGA
jgi:hypothetical protein